MVRVLLFLLLFASNALAQNLYCGQDRGLSSKVTLSNLALYSEEADNAAITKTACTIIANSVTAPNGTLTADTISETASTSDHNIRQSIAVTINDKFRFSGYAKAGSRAFLQISTTSTGFGTARYANFNLSNCTVGTIGASTTASAYSVGNGWCRLQIEATATASASTLLHYLIITSATAANFESYLGVATNNLYVWGAQAQLATASPDYLQTTATSATLGPVCASGTTQSPTNPSMCIALGDESFRRW